MLAGTGTADDPYQISTAAELREFAKLVNDDETTASAVLTDDIDLNNQPWYPIGSISSRYSGTFDGNGKTISGLYINSSTADDQGLFGYVDTGGTVKDLTVSGTVSGSGNFVGGVAGYNFASVENCYNTGSVTSSGSPVGGVVGYNGGTVENCYNTGSVTSNLSPVGGVVGDNEGTVKNCYNTGSVSGSVNGETTVNVGGVVGNNSFSGTVANCYNTGKVSGDATNLTTDEFKNTDNFTNWDFDNTWRISQSLNRPVLQANAEDNALSGTGKQEDPYKIYRAIDLKNFRDLVNDENGQTADTDAHAKLMNNIDLNGNELDQWTPIGNSSNEYSGTFNGDGHTISGLYINNSTANDQGLFGYVGTGGTVQNLSVSGSVSGYWYVGGVVGYNGGSVENCYNTGAVSGSGLYVGGVVGQNSDTVENCYNIGKVSGTGVGGVVGWNFGGTVENCYNIGDVSGPDSVDGVVGENSGGSTVENCYNTGKVSGIRIVGGVVGWNDSGTVKNCYNTGKVSGPDSGYSNAVGGVVGLNSGPVKNCYNTGTVSGPDSGTSNYVGGVVGWNISSGNVKNCYNTGSVSGPDSGTGDRVGGVVGYNSGTVKNCYNTGTVTGTDDYAGGVVGLNDGNVTGCYNTGSVKGPDSVSGSYVGGVVGYNIRGTVENCYNIGEVSGNSYVGGVVGYNTSSTVTGCYFLKTADVNKNLSGIGFGGEGQEAIQKTADAFHSGEVAWLLENGQAEDQTTPVWGQSNLKEKNSWPTLVALDKNENAKPVYKVVFISDNTEIEAQYANSGMTVDLPATEPTKEGYTFKGWFTESSGGSQWNFNDPVNKSMTLYAQWTAVEEPDPTPTPTPDPEPSGPSTGDSTGWDDIRDELENAEKGDQITIDMGDETKVPAEIFESLAGKDVDVTFDLGDIQWSVNGADIPTDTDFTDLDLGVNLGTSGIPVNVINTITGEVGSVQITLAHDGAFGFTMTLTAPLGKENAGYWANLYHYDEDAEALNFEAAAKIDETGSVTIPFSHASQYAIVIDTHSHAAVDVSDLFSDIAPDAWYKDAIQYAYDNGLMTGVSATQFAPEATTTRAMIVSILARLEGVESAQAAGFADVDDNDWYATAVNWAANVGVVNGYEDNTFKPNTAITREQLAAILMNYAAYKGEDVSNRADLTSYTDQPSTWAQEAMQWAVAEGLISGVTNTELQPQGEATRAQVAAILQRFLSE